MPTNDSERRYEDILRQISKRRPFGANRRQEKPRTPQDRVLDLINALDSFAELTGRGYRQILCYGPMSIRGRAWSAVLLWYHRKGYHGYQRLNLLGLWAHYREGELALSIGIRGLPYRAPVYDPGVYRVAIQSNFRIYYDDDGHPPTAEDRLLYHSPYKAKERLTHRQTLTDILQVWSQEIEAG